MISIIIPTLNEEKIIGKTLADLKAKLTIPHEIIVSDGQSTDRTVEIAKTYADKVVEYTGAKRQTIAQGRNDGAAAAKGDFLAFLDADCSFENPDDFFNQALERFKIDPKLVALTPKIKVLPELETLADKIFFGTLNFNKWLLNNALHHGESGGELQLMPRIAFDKIHGFREDLVTREDADMFMRLSRVGKTFYDSSLVLFHTGRRAHKIGWPRLLWQWTVNTVWVALFDKAKHKEWTVIR